MAKGSIVARGNSFRVQVSYTDGEGNRQFVTKTCPTKREAQAICAKMLVETRQDDFRKPTKETVGAYLPMWLATYAKPRLTPEAYHRYESLIRIHLVPALGNIAMSKLQPTDLQKLYAARLDAGLNPLSVLYMHSVIHKALASAVKWGKLSHNIADSVDAPHANRKEMQTWNEAEVNRFLEYAKCTPYYVLFYIALFSGARKGELLGLKWGDADLENGRLSIARSLTQVGTVFHVGEPKTPHSRRVIALPPSATMMLRLQKVKATNLRERLGTTLENSDYIFSLAPDGKKPLRPLSVTVAFERTARRAGVKVIRFHDLRHTHASLMLKENVPLKVVSERLGHASVAITGDIYSHVMPGLQESAAVNFDAALGIRDQSATIARK